VLRGAAARFGRAAVFACHLRVLFKIFGDLLNCRVLFAYRIGDRCDVGADLA